VSNRWLAQRFGGTLLYHVRDPHVLDPDRVEAAPMRAKLRLDDRPWVGFVGTVRPHKGLGDLVVALSMLRGPSAPGLLLLGSDPDDPVVKDLVGFALDVLGPRRLRVRRMFPLEELPAHLAAADVVCVPSRAMAHSRGQLPAKIFDAMAMGKPVVATAVNEVPEILEGCGIAVAPGDPAALAAALDEMRDPAARRQLGDAGRKKLVEQYSHERGRRVLREFALRAVS
jgi:glycosyltransferase involved in cell wall biosynthesis